jgi:hypothetical protein
LRLCQAAGLVKLGHVALDGSKVAANASKHKAMSYARMEETERRLQAEVRDLLDAAERVDAAEDAQFGRGRRGDELPAELARRETRLAAIRAAKAALDQEAREQAAQAAEEARAKLAAREQRVGSAKGGVAKIPVVDDARPAPTAQYNFTDPESRIMKDGATKQFLQGYNTQLVVDDVAQVVVACGVTQQATDVQQFVPMLERVHANVGAVPDLVTADAGYFSEANLDAAIVADTEVYVPPDRGGERRADPGAWAQRHGPPAAMMRAKLTTAAGAAIYARRKTIVEPVYGQIKEVRRFRRFSMRGYQPAVAEWAIVCLTHNLLKLFRARPRLCPA